MNNYLITLLNILLSEILNNENELVYFEALVTYKDLIKKYYSQVSIQGDETFEHINKNINLIYEKSESLLLGSENIKNMFDAKDIIVVLCEFNEEFKLKALKIAIKLLMTYISDRKHYFIKNANSLLFFVFKGTFSEDIETYLKTMQSNIHALVFQIMDIINENCPEEDKIVLADILTCLTVKVEWLITNKDEIKSIFNTIWDVYFTCKQDAESHMATCLNELIVKYEFLDNLDSIFTYLDDPVSSEKVKYNKTIGLLEFYFKNKKNSLIILNFLFGKLNNELSDNKALDFISSLINILDSKDFLSYVNNTNIIEDYYFNLINRDTAYTKLTYKETKRLGKAIMKVLKCNKLLNLQFLEKILTIIDKQKHKISNSCAEIYNNLNLCLKLIKAIINKDKIEDEIDKQLLFRITSSVEALYNEQSLNILKSSINILIDIIGLCGYHLSYLTDEASIGVYVGLLNFFNKEIKHEELQNNNNTLRLYLVLLNYLLLTNDNILAINKLNEFLTNIAQNKFNSEIDYKVLFSFNKHMTLPNTLIDKLSSCLASFSTINLSKQAYKVISYLTIKLYTNVSNENMIYYFDLVIDLVIRSILEDNNIKLSLQLFKRILKFFDKDMVLRYKIEMGKIIEKLLDVFLLFI
jgi:hypothetical protein